MHYVFYVPGMPFNGATLAQGRSLGGSESAGYYLARELARRGHEVTVFSPISSQDAGVWEGVRYLSAGAPHPGAPLGAAFEAFLAHTPVDVMIGQRVPDLFQRPNAAKVNLWWTHDLALRRHQAPMARQLWNVNAVLCVSEFHKRQVSAVYGLDPQRITVVPNGVDSTLFAPASARLRRENPLLLYSSRPERGLEHLVGWGTDGVAEEGGGEPGIMELLARELPELTLGVCAYDNTTPALAETYARLARRCTELPNVRWLGALSKSALGAHMSRAWLHIYPTTFEEVSCITAMETQCAGTPILTTPVAALPETLKGAGVTWVPLTPGGAVDRPAFARAIAELWRDESRWEALHRTALAKAPELGWNRAADAVEAVVAQVLSHQVSRPARLARHLLRMSDILPLQTWLEGKMPDLPAPRDPGTPEPQDTRSPLRGSGGEDAALLVSVREELDACYGFAREGDFFQHYRDYYAYERKRGVSYGPENLIGNPRYEVVSQALEDLPSGAVVLDLGCAHGHYTMNLARRFPHLNWIGMDLVAENIATARAWAESEGRTNVRFLHGTLESPPEALPPLDAVLAAEVLEHVTEPWALVDGLAQHLKPGGRMVLTTPYGPWESQGYREHWPWRAHLHHLEGEDLREAFGHHPEFRMIPVPAGSSAQGEPLGSYVTRFGCPRRPSRRPDWTRKLRQQKPRETLSVCMLTRPEGDTLARTLKSVASVADEIILGVDVGRLPDGAVPPEALGRAASIGAEFGARVFPLESPLHSGFDAARNATLARAGGDWVLWIDDDEELLWPERLPKYLRDNGYDAYALAQHHFAVEPGGLLKTDYPCRLFRNRRGFQFFGLVHEHPELGFNQGPGRVLVLGDLALCHNGYATEEVRRGRFQRNLPLMRKDREVNPERVLGKFLWIRDLAHLNRFEYETTGRVTPRMRQQAEEAVALWRGLVAEGHVRLAVDALPYYSECSDLLSGGALACRVDVGVTLPGPDGAAQPPSQPLVGHFLDPEDLERLTQALLTERTAPFRGRYV